ncbi:hypothetical protein [Streptomyces sp. SPB4]|uniref:hypothetical protein n=1 Tax=Streptomyces sp. SPB4 TaxID=2940553 RepID=UPI002473439F|nr:hypothetical protein [Streptomyces sp. SPB4]MDH6542032.1 hypothetical protein [Streptomyces sp. SPB4]
MLDETASHLLTGSLFCVMDAIVLVVGMNVGTSPQGRLTGVTAALAAGLSSYIALIFITILPRFYNAYVEMNNVSVELDGFDKRKTEG